MNAIKTTLSVENIKIRASKIIPFGILACIFVSFMIGFLMFISLHPELTNNSSIFKAKASFFSETTWQSYFTLLLQMISAFGLILFGFLTTWMFGREYSDRTLKDLLALPVSRSATVISKFIIISIYSFILSFVLFISSLLVGVLMGINGWSNELFIHVLLIYFVTVIFAILVTAPVALIASIGKGYLGAFAFIGAAVMISQFINLGLPGLDPYVPWAIPVIFSTTGLVNQSSLPSLNFISYLILIGTFLFGIIGTMYWWNYTDQF